MTDNSNTTKLRERILSMKPPVITITVAPYPDVQFRGLTGADADRISSRSVRRLPAREKLILVLNGQVEPPLVGDDLAGWSDDRLLATFALWARHEDGLGSASSEVETLESAAAAIDQFGEQWRQPIESFGVAVAARAAAPIAASELQKLGDPLGIQKLLREMSTLQAQAQNRFDPTLIRGIAEGVKAAELSQRRAISLAAARKFIAPDIPNFAQLWPGLGLADKLADVLTFTQNDVLRSASAATMIRTGFVAESLLSNIDLERLQPRLVGTEITALASAIGRHTSAFNSLVDSLAYEIPPVPPRHAYEIPANEVFTEGEMLRALTGEPDHEETAEERARLRTEIGQSVEDDLPGLLRELNPDFLPRWKGARDSLNGNNPEKARHVLVSLRTLTDDVIDILAPEKDVKAWAPTEITEQGRAQREARFKYIARNANFNRLVNDFVADMASLNKAYGMLNALHEGALQISDAELKLILLRIEAALQRLLLFGKI